MLKVKSVYSPIDREGDGLRILATRVRGRGLRSTRYDVWMASLGPSEKLLADGRSGKLSWAQFKTRYRREIVMDGPVDRLSKNIKNHGQKFTLRLIRKMAQRSNVTLMCHCNEDIDNCHRFLLRDLIAKA